MAYTDLTGTTTRTDGKIGFYKGTSAGTSRLRRKSTGEYIDIGPFVAYPTTQFLIDGDSMSALNSGMTSTETWAEHLRATLDAVVWGDFYNSAVGGQTIAQMLTNVDTEIDAKKSGTWSRHVVSCLMGINTIYDLAQGGLNATQIYEGTRTALAKYHMGRFNNGLITIAFTLTATQNPLYPELHTVMDEARVLLNEWIRLNWQSVLKAGALVDLDNTELGGYTGVLNTTYYQSDQIHWTDAGRQLAAQYIREQLPNLPLTDPTGTIVDLDTAGSVTATVTSSSITYGPSAWETVGGKEGRSSTLTGASVSATYSTTRLKLRAPVGPLGASFTVTINGMNYPGGTTYNATDVASALIWDSGELLPGSHTFVFTKVGSNTSERFYFDGFVFNISAPLAIDDRHVSFTTIGAVTLETDTNKYRSVIQTGSSTANTGTVFTEVGARKVTLCTAKRFRMYAPKFSGGGIVKMKITRVSDSVVVYEEEFNQANASTIKAGYPTNYTPQLDTGLMVETLYQLEVIAVTVNSSFDAVDTNQDVLSSTLPQVFENTAPNWNSDSGTWASGTSTAVYRGDGTYNNSNTVGSIRSNLLPLGTSRVKLYTAQFSAGGVIRMRILDIDTGTEVYTGDFNQQNATVVKSGEIPGTGWALDSGVLPAGDFKIELIHVSGTTVSFDAIELE